MTVQKGRLKSTVTWILAGVLLAALLMAGGIYSLLQPKIHTATRTEIEAVLPKELLIPVHHDADAQERYGRLVAEVKPSPSDSPSRSRARYPSTRRWWGNHLAASFLSLLLF